MKAKPKTPVNSGKSTATTSAAASLAKGKAKREKKVYSLAGQKFDPPEEVIHLLIKIALLNLSFSSCS